MHGLPVRGRLLLSVCWDIALDAAPIATPDEMYHTRGRRREEGVAVQLIAGVWLSMNKVLHMRIFRDTANAFPSISHTAILDGIDFINEPWIHDLPCDHVQTNISTIAKNDTDLSLRGDSGCFDGSSVGGRLFNCGFWTPFRKRCTERQRRGVANHLNVTCPLDGGDINTAATGFADDCGAVVTGASLEALTHLAKNDDAIFDTVLNNINLKQKGDEIVKQFKLFGHGIINITKAIQNNTIGKHQFQSEARYLRPWLHLDSSFDNECARRVQAMKV